MGKTELINTDRTSLACSLPFGRMNRRSKLSTSDRFRPGDETSARTKPSGTLILATRRLAQFPFC